ncbi:MAG: acetyltransferase [SAR324 cluster bacterium]|uniref:Acetyltransferase n=1 Tax=SAR324 cluster bacterium TaxID=2024889 RepID=A0A2A4SVM9_9DELT|nr:MAG: acetyltransferase [SAR324 cluster bacterium]
MFLKLKNSGALVDVLDASEMADPYHGTLLGCLQQGEDLPDPEPFKKADLCFLSGEPLPSCWVDAHYRDKEVFQRLSHR